MDYLDSLKNLTAAAASYATRFPGSLSSEQRQGMSRLAIYDGWAQMAADELNQAKEPIQDLRASLKRWQEASGEGQKVA